jgi:hypothetical protein
VKRLVGPGIAAAIVVVFGVGLADTPKVETIEPSHFSHGDHMNYKTAAGKIVDTKDPKNCGTCHSTDAKGMIKAPAAQGHAPCLQSKCHGDDPLTADAPSFFAISEKNSKSKDPKMVAAFQKASAFCLGCHEQVPWPWKKPSTRVLDGWVNQREHHIEMAKSATSTMDHWAHTQLKKKSGEAVGCRDCHAVDKDFKMLKGSPGHAQCSQCHNATDAVAFPMGECGKCHKSGSRNEWLIEVANAAYEKKKIKKSVLDAPTRIRADVFACGSQGEATLAKKGKKARHCFKHETKEHRTDNKGKDVQCRTCHWIVTDQKSWTSDTRYSNLADLHVNKLIGDPTTSDMNRQHAACAGCHPHKAQVELATAACEYCHAIRTTDPAKQEPYW